MQSPALRAALAAGLSALAGVSTVAAGGAGPKTFIDNPGNEQVFVDGARTTHRELPFRYYGATRVSALPADENGRADWSQQPTSVMVPVPAPASPWLFPLDFPIEVLRWTFLGQPATTAVVALPPSPAELQAAPDVRPTGIELVHERALQARISR